MQLSGIDVTLRIKPNLPQNIASSVSPFSNQSQISKYIYNQCTLAYQIYNNKNKKVTLISLFLSVRETFFNSNVSCFVSFSVTVVAWLSNSKPHIHIKALWLSWLSSLYNASCTRLWVQTPTAPI